MFQINVSFSGATSPWAFGWTHILTLCGFLITLGLAVVTYRSFRRWKLEKLEEKRIDVAIEAAAIAYEHALVFEKIRSGMTYAGEWDTPEFMQKANEAERSRAGHYYAYIKRIEAHKDYFDRVIKLQPRMMALFGPQFAGTFRKLLQARRNIQVSASMLMRSESSEYESVFRKGLEIDLYGSGAIGKSGLEDNVGKMLTEFESEIVTACQPVLISAYRPRQQRLGWRIWPWS